MGLKAFTFSKGNKKITLKLKKCNVFGHAIGLMLRTKNTFPLLFEVKKPMAIHSFFVFFPFVAVWLDKNNKVIEMRKVNPFTLNVLPKKHFAKLIEIPINKKNEKLLKILGF